MGNRTAEAVPCRAVPWRVASAIPPRPAPSRPIHGLPDIPQMGDTSPFWIRPLFGYVLANTCFLV